MLDLDTKSLRQNGSIWPGKALGSPATAAKLRKAIEKQVAQSAAKTEAEVMAALVRRGKAGWVNEFKKSDAVLVQRGTGCRLIGANGKVILGSRPAERLVGATPYEPSIHRRVHLRRELGTVEPTEWFNPAP